MKNQKRRITVGSVFVFTLLSFAHFASASAVVDVKNIQAEIKKQNANWVAKESTFTHLTETEAKRMLGSNEEPTGSLSFSKVGIESTAGSIDWRNVNGTRYVGDVMNQGNCGSCVAFATVATLEAQVSITAGSPWLKPSFSPQDLFACGGGGCDSGWLPGSAASFLKSEGIPDEACFPYESGSTGEDMACNAKNYCKDKDQRSLKIISSYRPSSGFFSSADAVKAALKKGPLVTTLVVYADFLTYSSGVYKTVGGSRLGGHAVSLVGYDDAKRAWIIRNSWGPEWGDKGFAYVSYDDKSGIASSTWGFEVPQQKGYLSVAEPSDLNYVASTIALKALSSQKDNSNVKFRVRDSNGAEMLNAGCTTMVLGNCLSNLDTLSLKDGRYEILAEDGATGLKSQVREFYVANQEPKLSLSFAPVSGVDLSKPLKDRIEFTLKAGFSTVPMQKVEFMLTTLDGKLVTSKATDRVYPEMKLGFRTNSVPDGTYLMYFHGSLPANGKLFTVDSQKVKVVFKN